MPTQVIRTGTDIRVIVTDEDNVQEAVAAANAAAQDARDATASIQTLLNQALATIADTLAAIRVVDYVQINDDGFLIVYYTNGTQDNAGFVADQVPTGAVTNSTGGYVRNASGGFVIGSLN